MHKLQQHIITYAAQKLKIVFLALMRICNNNLMRGSFIIILSVSHLYIAAQSKLSVNGYISEMGQVTETTVSAPFFDNTIHNRINIALYATQNITIHTQLRNQFVWGKTVEITPNYAQLMEADAGYLNMSFNWWAEPNNILNTKFDRAYVEYIHGKFEASVGRQRINWGRTLVWNPNDLFNSFSYYDFDYPERPGSDAIKLSYYTGAASKAELVAKIDSTENITIAALYKFNHRSFDIQFLSGYVNNEDIVAGAGWEGNIGPVSFRGEGSYYHPAQKIGDTIGVVLSSISFDYAVNSKFTTQFEMLYNDNKTKQTLATSTNLFAAPGSSKSLSFSQMNYLCGITYQINPILNTGASAMYFPDMNGYLFMPSLNISITNNFAFMLMYYHFSIKPAITSLKANMFFARLKWNF